MRHISSTLLAIALATTPVYVAHAQSGTETFAASGIYNGRAYNSITVNYDTRSMTFNFNDGGQFTSVGIEPNMFAYMVRRLKLRSESMD